MTDEQYIQQLSSSIAQYGYNTQYVEKCIEYAQRLLSNKMPVIFDTKHLALLIGTDINDLTKMVFCEELFYSKTDKHRLLINDILTGDVTCNFKNIYDNYEKPILCFNTSDSVNMYSGFNYMRTDY